MGVFLAFLCQLMICRDIQVLKTYGTAPYAQAIKKVEEDVKDLQKKVNEKIGEPRFISSTIYA